MTERGACMKKITCLGFVSGNVPTALSDHANPCWLPNE
jgi:hypothetical protein